MMIKFMFFDYRGYEIVDGFERRLQPPRKHPGNPIMVNEHPETGISFYGSVIRRPGDKLWQMWYTTARPKLGMCLGYAESADGIAWQRPRLDVVKAAKRPTNVVFDRTPHGACVFYDEREERPGWKYKMLCGAAPSHCISYFRSADGIHWHSGAEGPVIGSNPDCPISLLRANDGRYVAYHRPGWADRRVGRSESYDCVKWSEAKMVLDQQPGDPPQTQFYGLGSALYGPYEIGTLWIYHTDANDMDFYKMLGHQETELAYARGGYAWRRAAPGVPWIKLGAPGSWEWGNIQAASAPVFLEDEIRYYYAASRTAHGTGKKKWKSAVPRCGVGMATMKPDRFVSLVAADRGTILTRPFWTETPRVYVNAAVARKGELRLEVADLAGKPIRGFELGKCLPIAGDSTRHPVLWRGDPNPSVLANRQIRLRVQARDAKLYSLAVGPEAELKTYRRFRLPHFAAMDVEKARL